MLDWIDQSQTTSTSESNTTQRNNQLLTCLRSIGVLMSGTFSEMNFSKAFSSTGCRILPAIMAEVGPNENSWRIQSWLSARSIGRQLLYGFSHNLFTVDVYESGDYDKNKNAMKLCCCEMTSSVEKGITNEGGKDVL